VLHIEIGGDDAFLARRADVTKAGPCNVQYLSVLQVLQRIAQWIL
jgi:hypothetical protein